MSDSNMLTVSFGTWMELPNLKMTEWRPTLIDNAETRVTVATVAEYYQDYVRQEPFSRNFPTARKEKGSGPVRLQRLIELVWIGKPFGTSSSGHWFRLSTGKPLLSSRWAAEVICCIFVLAAHYLHWA